MMWCTFLCLSYLVILILPTIAKHGQAELTWMVDYIQQRFNRLLVKHSKPGVE